MNMIRSMSRCIKSMWLSCCIRSISCKNALHCTKLNHMRTISYNVYLVLRTAWKSSNFYKNFASSSIMDVHVVHRYSGVMASWISDNLTLRTTFNDSLVNYFETSDIISKITDTEAKKSCHHMQFLAICDLISHLNYENERHMFPIV